MNVGAEIDENLETFKVNGEEGEADKHNFVDNLWISIAWSYMTNTILLFEKKSVFKRT